MTEIVPPRQHEKYDRLIATAKKQPALVTAVAHPCDETSLRGALEAAEEGLIKPILVGPKQKIENVAKSSRSISAASRSLTSRTAKPPPRRRLSSCARARPSCS